MDWLIQLLLAEMTMNDILALLVKNEKSQNWNKMREIKHTKSYDSFELICRVFIPRVSLILCCLEETVCWKQDIKVITKTKTYSVEFQ
jgi:hypothetical protein